MNELFEEPVNILLWQLRRKQACVLYRGGGAHVAHVALGGAERSRLAELVLQKSDCCYGETNIIRLVITDKGQHQKSRTIDSGVK